MDSSESGRQPRRRIPPPAPRTPRMRHIPVRAPLPSGLELMTRHGTFYPLEANANLFETADNYILGIEDPNGILRPIFRHRIIVKVKRVETRDYQIMPLTLREYRHFNYNSDLTTNTDPYLQYVAQIRRQPF